MNPPPAEIGVSVDEVETPALVIDLDSVEGFFGGAVLKMKR